jgi:anthranilate synthase component II
MKLLVLDNYDSFTYNLVHLVEKVSDMDVNVVKNNQISLDEVEAYDKVLLSPGPGLPSEAGIMPELLKRYAHKKSILGVCLGLQAIGEAFGSPLKNLNQVYHGVAGPIRLVEIDPLFEHCPESFLGGRYHSWVIDETYPNPNLLVTAVDEKGLIMAARHRVYDVRGVQFHPESILSEHGETLIKNWLNLN